MDKVMVTFKYESQLNTRMAKDYTNGELVKEIVELLRGGGVEMCGYEQIHGEEIDNPCDTDEPVTENHTVMEVRLEINESPDEEEAIDWHDGGDSLFYYVLEALEEGEPEIMYFYTSGEEPMQKSVIGIEIHPAY